MSDPKALWGKHHKDKTIHRLKARIAELEAQVQEAVDLAVGVARGERSRGDIHWVRLERLNECVARVAELETRIAENVDRATDFAARIVDLEAECDEARVLAQRFIDTVDREDAGREEALQALALAAQEKETADDLPRKSGPETIQPGTLRYPDDVDPSTVETP